MRPNIETVYFHDYVGLGMGTIDITLGEFKGFVYSLDLYFEETSVGGEAAFESNIGQDYTLRILTSIDANADDDEAVRPEGTDAIRVHLASPDSDIVQSTPHTKRTPGWRDRIKDKIDEIIGCPDCDGTMRLSDGDYGLYFFCTECDHTESFEE